MRLRCLPWRLFAPTLRSLRLWYLFYRKAPQHQIVLKLAPARSKVYASGKFVCGLFVRSLSEGQILNNQAPRIGCTLSPAQTVHVDGALRSSYRFSNF